MFFGLHVARTLGSGIVSSHLVDAAVVFGALMGAIPWNIVTWIAGIPSSSSHALVGGLVGAGVEPSYEAALGRPSLRSSARRLSGSLWRWFLCWGRPGPHDGKRR